MTTATAGEAPARAWTVLDRVYAAIPLALVFVLLSILYGWEAHGHVSPWLFGDELEHTQIARGIAATGHAARRGESYQFSSLYSFVLAFAWLFHGTGRAYAIAKYLGIFTMTASIFPTYFLARMIASKRSALFAAAAAGAIPAFAYSSMLLFEPLAYTWAALTLFLIAKGLATRNRRWLAGALAACIVAHWVRSELTILIAVFVLGALFLVLTSERAGRWRAGWSRWDWAGAIAIAIGAVVLFSAIMSKSSSWLTATGNYRGRMIDYGLWAAGAFTIGLGVLPVVGGLSALIRPRGERRSPELRSFTAVAVAAFLAFGLYTAVKAAYLSTQFATLIEERNLIYVAPVLFCACALWLDRPRLRIVPVLCAAGFAGYVLTSTPYALDNVPYSDAFGLSLLATGNRDLSFSNGGIQWLLLSVLWLSLILLLVPRLLGGRQRLLGTLLGLTAALVLAWNVAGQVSAAVYSNDFSKTLLGNFPKPPTWLDQATGGKPVLFLGQNVDSGEAGGLNLLEFWNPSLKAVWSLDGTAPGPGPTLSPDLKEANGELSPDPGYDYVLADHGIDVVGKQLKIPGVTPWVLFKIQHPLRLAHGVSGISPDGWMSTDSAYSQYSTPGGKAGYVLVTISRTAWRGHDKPGTVTILVGKLVKGKDRQPHLGQVTDVRGWVVHAGIQKTFAIPTPKPPYRVQVHVEPTFSPHDYGESDARQLGAQVGFRFALRKPGS